MSLTDEQRVQVEALRRNGFPSHANALWLLDLVDSLEKENKQLRNELSHWRRP